VYYTQIMQAECLAAAYRYEGSTMGLGCTDFRIDYGDASGVEKGRSIPQVHSFGRCVILHR
jgi:hypothetical protein